ncbi:MAG: HprK-related kinase A [Planctomycetota bacterium]
MKVRDVPRREFVARLRREGIHLRTGAFVTKLKTSYRDVAEAVHFLYADHELDGADGFADFHLDIVPQRGIRRYVRRQALLLVDGRELFEPFPAHSTAPLLEWGMNWCVAASAHQYLVVHAAVLERDGRAVVMPARPGTGKSTLCAGLAHRGWRLLSDELTLLRPADGRIDALPRPISLKNESIEVLRAFAPEAKLGRVWPETTKGRMAHVRPPADAVARGAEPADPAWVVFPTYKAGRPASFDAHEKAGAFMRVADNAVNYGIQGEQGFETVTRLIDRSACYEFEYGDLEEAVAAFARLAEAPVVHRA